MLCSPGIDTTLLGFGNMNVLKINLEVGRFSYNEEDTQKDKYPKIGLSYSFSLGVFKPGKNYT